MHYTYSSLYHVRGLVPASPAVDEEIFADRARGIRAILTSNPAPLCDRLDMARAVRAMLLTGPLGGQEPGTVDERLGAQVQQLRDERAKKFEAGVFLFFEANGDTDPIKPHVQRNCGDFVLALDGLPKREIRDCHEPLARKVLTAICLGMPSVAGFEVVADEIVFFVDNGRPIYGFNFEGGSVEVLVSRRPSAGDLVVTCQLASRMAQDASLDRVVRLLNESLEPNQEKVRRFPTAWMALEVFVNKNFDAYQKRFWDGLSAGVSQPIRRRYLERIHRVMADKYKLLDKFVVISAELDPSEADGDIAMFQRSKDVRDRFSHGETIDENALQVTEVQGILRRFLLLHFSRI